MNPFSWSGRKCLVTGAGGFIGSHLCEALVTAGAEVTAFVHYRALESGGWLRRSPFRHDMRIESGDITDRDSLNAVLPRIDTVFHLAALISIPHSHRSPTAFIRTQIEGTANVILESARHSVRKVLMTSTSEVYGSARTAAIAEDHPLSPRSPYAATKVGAEQLADTLALSHRLGLAIVRPFNTFGPRQSARAIIPSLLCQAIAQKEVRVGNLHPTRDFTFVDDMVRGLLAVAARPEPRLLLNLGTGNEIAIGTLIEKVSELLGYPIAIALDPQRVRSAPTEVDRLCADARKARALTGWEPQVSFTEGLRRTWEWIRENPGNFDPEIYSR